MKRLLIIAVAALATAGCAEVRGLTHRDGNPYEKAPFYAKYLNTGSALDAEMQRILDELRANPASAELHNDLGALLIQKGFPKDAAREFERAVDADKRYVPAWYNLGLVRAANGDALGARRALARTIDLKPGHSAALFQLGLIEEKRMHTDRAVALYAKAYSINPALLEVEVNPRVLDSQLTDLALIRMYTMEHTAKSMQFQDAPGFDSFLVTPAPNSSTPRATETPAAQPAARTIVVPAAPAGNPGAQTETAQPSGRRRPRNQAQPPQNPPN